MDSPQTKVSAALLGLILQQSAKLHALNLFVGVLAEKQGISTDDYLRILDQKTKTEAERLLLNLGDSFPEIAELIDISDILKQDDKGERE